jgi:hypothetical protein
MNKIKCSFCGFANSSIEKNCTMCEVSLSGSQSYSKSYSYSNPNVSSEKLIVWKTVFSGLAMIAFSGFLFYILNNIEQKGGSVTMPLILIVIYKLFGKWVLSSLFGLIGLIMLAMGFSGTDLDDK